ncbi:hypothetical protein NUACC21_44040 [Scytonema sp. NUACC21]
MLLDNWQNVQNLLVIRGGSSRNPAPIVPTLQQLRESLPSSSITLMVSSHTSELDSHLPWVDEVFVYEGLGTKFTDAERELALISKLCQCAFDAAVICTAPGESPYPLAYICYLAEIPIRIGHSQEFGGGVLSKWIEDKG